MLRKTMRSYSRLFKVEFLMYNIVSKRGGFSLLEIIVAVAIFAVTVVGAGGMFISMQQAWERQRDTIELVQDVRWAIEFMTNEIRQADQSTINIFGGGTRLEFQLDPDGDGNPPYRDIRYEEVSNVFYRSWKLSTGAVWSSAQELANFISANPTNPLTGNPYPIFDMPGGSFVEIWLTVAKNNENYTLSTKITPKN